MKLLNEEKKHEKKFMTILLTTSMVFSGIAGCATGVKNEVQKVYAEDEKTGTCGENGNLTWTLKDKVLTIQGEDKLVNCNFFNEDIEKVIIEDGVSVIGSRVFQFCDGMKEIEIPDTVTSIDMWAFRGCSGLEEIEIPSGVTKIDSDAFVGCSGLKKIVVDEDNNVYDSRDNCNAIIDTKKRELILGCQNSVIPDGIIKIGSGAFSECTGLKEIEIPNSLKLIRDSAFSGCSGLKEIKIPDSVTTIEEDAFYGCTGLKEIKIPDAVTIIGQNAFSGCIGLEEIEISSFVTEIGIGVVSNCSNLKKIVVDENNDVYDSRNNCNAIISTEENKIIAGCENTVIPDTVTTIGLIAFAGCSGLKEIKIPDSVISIEHSAFSECIGLEEIEISSSVIVIGPDVFYDCSSLKKIVVDENNDVYDSRDNCNAIIETESNELIRGCQNTVIPNTVTSIGDFAFDGADNVVIYGTKGSYAETYANNNEIPFVDINSDDEVTASISYKTQVQKQGWQEFVSDGETSGTVGKALRLEAIQIKVESPQDIEGGISYRTHVQKKGWQDYVNDGETSGTVGKSLRLEAIQIKLTGDYANYFDVYYRVQAEKFGWLGWAKNDEQAGTAGYGYRLEGIQIVLVDKDEAAPTEVGGVAASDKAGFYNKNTLPVINYKVQVQTYGWQDYVKNGATSGTVGKAKRLEAIKIKVADSKGISGGVTYRTHVQKQGWQSWVSNDALSGTVGKALRLEAIQINLTGELAEKFDIYYRVQAQKFGWMGWAKNGAQAGTAGYAYRLEAIQIQLAHKGTPASTIGSTSNAFRSK